MRLVHLKYVLCVLLTLSFLSDVYSQTQCLDLLSGGTSLESRDAATQLSVEFENLNHWFTFSISGDFVNDLEDPYDRTQKKVMIMYNPATGRVVNLPYGSSHYRFGPYDTFVSVNMLQIGRPLEMGEIGQQLEDYGSVIRSRDYPTFPYEVLDTKNSELLLAKITGYNDFNNLSDPDEHGDLIATRIGHSLEYQEGDVEGLGKNREIHVYIVNIFNQDYRRLDMSDAVITPTMISANGLHYGRDRDGHVGDLKSFFFNKEGERFYTPTTSLMFVDGQRYEGKVNFVDFEFKEGRVSFIAEVQIDGRAKKKYGFLNTDVEVEIPAQFEKVGEFNSGKALVLKDGLWGLIDPQGEWIREPEWEWVSGGELDKYIIVKKPNESKIYVLDVNTFEELYALDENPNDKEAPLLPNPDAGSFRGDLPMVEIKDGMIAVSSQPSSTSTSLTAYGSSVSLPTLFDPLKSLFTSLKSKKEKVLNKFARGLFDLETRKWVVPPRTFSTRSDVMIFSDDNGKVHRFIRAEVNVGYGSIYEGVIDLSTGDWVFGFETKKAEEIFNENPPSLESFTTPNLIEVMKRAEKSNR